MLLAISKRKKFRSSILDQRTVFLMAKLYFLIIVCLYDLAFTANHSICEIHIHFPFLWLFSRLYVDTWFKILICSETFGTSRFYDKLVCEKTEKLDCFL